MGRAAAARLRNSWWAGGGTTWSTPALDPQTGLIFLGTGNPSPVGASFLRPGDTVELSVDGLGGQRQTFAQA